MGGELEAAGALANAGLVAGVIEGREPGLAGEGSCLNCGQTIVGAGRFCSNCGQAAHAHRKLWHLIEEVLHNLFHFDTKAWRTLPMLIGRPGTLTRNYTYGKRARYVSPLATFLLTIFFMFFAFQFVKSPLDNNNPALPGAHTTVEARANLAEARTALADAEKELRDARASPDPDQPAGLEIRLAEQGVNLARAEVARREASLARAEQRERSAAQAPVEPANATTTATTAGGATTTTAAPAAATAPATPSTTTATTATTTTTTRPAEHLEEGTWQQQLAEKASQPNFVVMEGNPVLNQRIVHTLQNPDLMVYKMIEAAAKFAFLLVPISLPFIWLLFIWKRGLTLYDHAVFALYALSFASLLCVAVIGAAQTPWLAWSIPWALCLGLPTHVFFQMKGGYKLGWWSALWRTFFMLIFAFVALCIWIVIVVFLGLLG